MEIKGEHCGAFHINAKVIEKNTRMAEYKTDSTANFINSNISTEVSSTTIINKNTFYGISFLFTFF